MKKYTLNELFKTSWGELNAKEIMDVVAISEKLHQLKDQDSTAYGLQVISMLRVLRKNKAAVEKIDVDQAVDCFNAIKFFERKINGEFVSPWLHFPIGGFDFHHKKFCAPEMNGNLPMYNRTFDQLVYADSAFSTFCVMNYEFQQTQSKDLAREMDDVVNGLIGILYNKPDDFDPVNMEKNARVVALHYNTPEKALILHTYANIRAFIIKRCANLFPQQEEDPYADPSNPPAPRQTGPMWMNLRYDLAETEAFKGLNTARNAWMYDALDYLDKKALENLNRKKQHG